MAYQRPIVALDFDGVICDSMGECLLIAVNGYRRWQDANLDWLDLDALDPDLVRRFRLCRYHVRPPGEYWLLVHFLETQKGLLDAATFARWLVRYSAEVADFESKFFALREERRQKDLDHWLGLHHRFGQFDQGIELLRQSATLHIVTTKDSRSVELLGQRWNLGIDMDHCWARDRVPVKARSIEIIAQQAGVPCSDIFFVDDHPDHLRDVAATGAKVFWATWGYASEDANVDDSLTPLENLADLLPHLPTANTAAAGDLE